MRAARGSLGAGLLVLSLLLPAPVLARADAPNEAEAKRLIEADRVKKLVEDAHIEARGLLRTNPSKALELLRSALDVLENDQLLPPERRQTFIRRLKLTAKIAESEVRDRERLAEKQGQDKSNEAPSDPDFMELLQPRSNFSEYPPMAKAIQRATKVVLYEGLPHQSFEGSLLKEEHKSKKTVEIHGFPFYQEVLPLKTEDVAKLRDTVCDRSSFSPVGGMKWCGGFHPDYCIEWQDGKDVYQILICFGCHEAKLYSSKAEVYCDVSDEADKQLRKILQPYRKNRPDPNSWPVPLATARDASTRGRYNEAEVYVTFALQQARQSSAGERAIADCLIQQAEVALRQGQFGKTNESAGRAQLLLEKLHGPEHPDVALCLELRADAYLAVGLPTVAFKLARQSGILRKKAFGEKHLEFARALETLARIDDVKRRRGCPMPDKDEQWCGKAAERALAIRLALAGEGHPDLIPTLLVQGFSRKERQRLLRQAEALIRKHHGEKHPLMAECLREQAWLEFRQDNYQAAEKLLQHSLDVSKKTLGPGHPSTYLTLELLSQVSKCQCNVPRAETLLLDSIRCRFRGLSDAEMCWFFQIVAPLRDTFNPLQEDSPSIYEVYLTEMIARRGATIEACLQQHYDELAGRHGRAMLYNHFRDALISLPFSSLKNLPYDDDRFESMEVLTALRRIQGRADPIQIVVRSPRILESCFPELPQIAVALRNEDSLGQPSGFAEGGDYRSGRFARWRFQVQDSRGKLLPIPYPAVQWVEGGGFYRRRSLNRGEEWATTLPMSDYVTSPIPGTYKVRILYHDHRELVDAPLLAGLITCQSPEFQLKVSPRIIEVSLAERNRVKHSLNKLDPTGPVKVVGGAYGPWAHKFLDPGSPAGQILTLGWKAVPDLLEELERENLPVKQRAWVLALLFSITGRNDPLSTLNEVLGDRERCDRPQDVSGGSPGQPPSGGFGLNEPGSAKGTINAGEQKAFALRWKDWKKSLTIKQPGQEPKQEP